MKRACLILLVCVLQGCAPKQRDITLFAISPPTTVQSLPLPILLEAIDSAPAYMRNDLLYRLDYADARPHPYANSRWQASPDTMFASALLHAGGSKLLTLDQPTQHTRCALRVGLTGFEQAFNDQQNSYAELRVNFSLMQLRNRLELKRDSLYLKVPAATADARGGAQALQTASQQAAEQIIRWLNELLNPAASGSNPVYAACSK